MRLRALLLSRVARTGEGRQQPRLVPAKTKRPQFLGPLGLVDRAATSIGSYPLGPDFSRPRDGSFPRLPPELEPPLELELPPLDEPPKLELELPPLDDPPLELELPPLAGTRQRQGAPGRH